VNDLIVNTLNSFSIDPENDGYQQRRSEDDNEQEAIFFLHEITGGRHFIKSEITCIRAENPYCKVDKSLTRTGQKMDIYRKPL
jgi:hypothetical protein